MRAPHRHAREPRVAAAKKQLLIGLAAHWLAASSRSGVLDPQGPVGSAERPILLNATGIMLVVVVPVIVLTLGFAGWYRSSKGDSI
jgi:heme/copper-type cytochrome/quinol oxidase subunit 2